MLIVFSRLNDANQPVHLCILIPSNPTVMKTKTCFSKTMVNAIN